MRGSKSEKLRRFLSVCVTILRRTILDKKLLQKKLGLDGFGVKAKKLRKLRKVTQVLCNFCRLQAQKVTHMQLLHVV